MSDVPDSDRGGEMRRTVELRVSSGPYATVRAWEKATRLYGENVRLDGIVGPTWGRVYTYVVSVAGECGGREER